MADDLDTIFAPLSTPKTGEPEKPSLDTLFAPLTPSKQIAPPKTFDATVRSTDPTVDYETGAPPHVRYSLFKASNDREQQLEMANAFGAENVRKTPDGQWQFKRGDKWTAVFPRGVMESINTGGAFAAANAPKLAAPAVGAAMGAPAGPLGMMAGAMGGAGVGYGLDELLHKVPFGTFAKTPLETLKEGGADMLTAGAFQGAGPAFNAGKNALYNTTSGMVRRLGSAPPETLDLARNWIHRFPDAPPPVISVAPGMKRLERDRQLRNELTSDPMLAPRVAAVDERVTDALRMFGVQDIPRALDDIKSATAKLSPQAASEKALTALRTEERGLNDTERQALQTAETALTRQYQTRLRTQQRLLDPKLGENFASDYETAGKTFRQNMNVVYGAATQATGSQPVVRVPGEIMRTVDPLTVPSQIKNLIDTDTGDLRELSFLEAHRLRTWLRDRANIRTGDQAPIGQQAGDFHRMAGQVDDAMGQAATEHPAAAQARELLKKADEEYKAGVVRFTDAKRNNLVWNIKQGRSPDPGEVADALLDKNSAASTRQVWDMLSPNTKTAVETADLHNMLSSASMVGKDGRRTLDPDALLAALKERSSLTGTRDEPFVHDPTMMAALERSALDMKALRGDIDITALSSGRKTTSQDVRQQIETAVGARRALVERAQADPAGSLTSENGTLANAGADYFLANEARTTAAAQRFGEASPEWQDIKKYALLDLLRSSVVSLPGAKSEGVGRTVTSSGLTRALGNYTEAQQKVLFAPDVLDDLKTLVKELNMVFPELRGGSGVGMAAMELTRSITTKKGFLRNLEAQLFGRFADSPALIKTVVGELRRDPDSGRGLLSWMLQGGAETLMQSQGRSGQAPPDVSAFRNFMAPTPKKPLPKNYGGVSE